MLVLLSRFQGSSLLFAMVIFASSGCSFAPAEIKPPDIDPAELTSAIIMSLDKDGNQAIDKQELSASPALLGDLTQYDGNSDQQISKDELAQQIARIFSRGVGLTSLECTVLYQGQPLADAEVRFIPELFLGDAIKPAQGKTDANGFTAIAIPDDQLPKDQQGLTKMHLGLYRVEITHPTKKIPARYNSSSTLGYGMHPAKRGDPLVFELK